MNLNVILEKLSDFEFEDVFPLNQKQSTIKNVLIATGIYLAIALVAGILIMLLGSIFILGVLIKIVGIVACGYSVVGMVTVLLNYMKYN